MGGGLHTPPCIDSLPIIGANETFQDILDIELPSVDPPPTTQPPIFPTPPEVVTEDDLIGKWASITDEDCLKQLATFLMLPVHRCPYRCNVPHVECQCPPPSRSLSLPGVQQASWKGWVIVIILHCNQVFSLCQCICIGNGFVTLSRLPTLLTSIQNVKHLLKLFPTYYQTCAVGHIV